VQIVVLKAYRNKISDKRNIGVTQSAPLFYPKAKRISAKSGAIACALSLASLGAWGQLCSFLIPNSSFLIPNSSLDRFFYLKCTKMLEKYQKICYNIIDYIRMLQQHRKGVTFFAEI